ncbi:MAG: hypothetical protein GXP62_17545 [Oligoflexia bacterium]|nr:hypothetical protein [Oligoflexia bacterium]
MSPSSFALAVLLCPGAALAQTQATKDLPVQEPSPATGVQYQDRTILDAGDFEILHIDGTLVGPRIHMDTERQHKRGPGWIRLRRDFSTEMSDSTTQIR